MQLGAESELTKRVKRKFNHRSATDSVHAEIYRAGAMNWLFLFRDGVLAPYQLHYGKPRERTLHPID